MGGEGAGVGEQGQEGRARARQVQAVLAAAGGGARFSFVVASSAAAYLAVLLELERRRRGHELEVAHDELQAAVAPEVEALAGGRYVPAAFAADVEQLARWGNLSLRVEPTRIRSLSDRGRSKLLVRLDPETSRFLGFLESRVEPPPVGLHDEGLNLLEDVERDLLEATRVVRRAARSGEGAGRAAHLVREVDRKTERIAEELLRFGDALSAFVAEPFRIESLSGLTAWLERYVERYLAVLDERGDRIVRARRLLVSPRFAGVWEAAAKAEEERLRDAPLPVAARPRPARDVLDDVARFFEGEEGLRALCARINRRTREAIRRIARHVEEVRLRNVRLESLRSCVSALASLEGEGADRAAKDFLERLVASAHVPGDAREGTPEARAIPPRPARRHETVRPAFAGAVLEGKSSEPGAARALELRRLAVLSAFVDRAVLRGRASAPLSGATLVDVGDARRLVQAWAAYHLRSGKHRPHLSFALERASGRARLEGAGFELTAPEALVRRKGG